MTAPAEGGQAGAFAEQVRRQLAAIFAAECSQAALIAGRRVIAGDLAAARSALSDARRALMELDAELSILDREGEP